MSAARRAEHAESGLLVGAEYEPLPEGHPPLTAEDVENGVIYGCPEIECLRCKRRVKDRPGVMWATPPLPQQLEAAWDADDYDAFTKTNAFSAKYRIYACRCDFAQVKRYLTLEDAYRDHDLQWVCKRP